MASSPLFYLHKYFTRLSFMVEGFESSSPSSSATPHRLCVMGQKTQLPKNLSFHLKYSKYGSKDMLESAKLNKRLEGA